MSKDIFDKLYKDIDGSAVSWIARNKLPKSEIKHLIYGEMSYDSLIEIFSDEKIKNYLPKYSNFCDLGSGTGRIVVEVSMLLNNLKNFTGIEILKELYDTSNKVLKKYLEIDEEKAKKINFINDNFFNVDLSKYDLIFMHYPMNFAEDLYLQLEEKMKNELRSGSMIISVIESLKNDTIFEKIAEKNIKSDYFPETPVNYYVKND